MVLTLNSYGIDVKLNKAPFESGTNFLSGLGGEVVSCYVSGTFEKKSPNFAYGEGEIECTVATSCYRCGADVKKRLIIPFREEFSTDENDDCYKLNGSQIELDQMIIDLILTNYPNSVLCKEGCLGRCDKCGKNLNEGKCDCKKEIILNDPANPFNELKKLKEE